MIYEERSERLKTDLPRKCRLSVIVKLSEKTTGIRPSGFRTCTKIKKGMICNKKYYRFLKTFHSLVGKMVKDKGVITAHDDH